MTCPTCERYKQSASMWRNKAYELGGTPLPWEPEELLRKEYERGFIDGMQKQMQSSVDKAVNRMAQPEQDSVAMADYMAIVEKYAALKAQRTWVGLTDAEFIEVCQMGARGNWLVAFHRIQAKLKEKNT